MNCLVLCWPNCIVLLVDNLVSSKSYLLPSPVIISMWLQTHVTGCRDQVCSGQDGFVTRVGWWCKACQVTRETESTAATGKRRKGYPSTCTSTGTGWWWATKYKGNYWYFLYYICFILLITLLLSWYLRSCNDLHSNQMIWYVYTLLWQGWVC